MPQRSVAVLRGHIAAAGECNNGSLGIEVATGSGMGGRLAFVQLVCEIERLKGVSLKGCSFIRNSC